MKLCIHGHAMTPENTGRCEYFNKQGRRYTLIYCKQCRRDSSQKFYAKHGRVRKYTRKKPDDEVRSLGNHNGVSEDDPWKVYEAVRKMDLK